LCRKILATGKELQQESSQRLKEAMYQNLCMYAWGLPAMLATVGMVLIDEAERLNLAQFLTLLFMAPQVVALGDPLQLGPFDQFSEIRKIAGISEEDFKDSPFRLLRERKVSLSGKWLSNRLERSYDKPDTAADSEDQDFPLRRIDS